LGFKTDKAAHIDSRSVHNRDSLGLQCLQVKPIDPDSMLSDKLELWSEQSDIFGTDGRASDHDTFSLLTPVIEALLSWGSEVEQLLGKRMALWVEGMEGEDARLSVNSDG
jgi:hypothetical protein